MSSDGKVHAAGSDNLVTGMVSDVELYRKAKACIKSHATEESDGYATTHALAYPHLPCSLACLIIPLFPKMIWLGVYSDPQLDSNRVLKKNYGPSCPFRHTKLHPKIGRKIQRM